MWKKHLKEIVILTIFLIGAFAIGIASTSLNTNQTRSTSAFAAEVDDSCRDGVYYVKNPDNTNEQISCGRGVCGGVDYKGTAGIDANRNGKCWWGSGSCGLACKGYVPLCCYKMAQTGDAEHCPFPERKYCRQDQCKKQTIHTDSNCGSGIKTYCVDIPNCLADRDAVPILTLEDRLSGKKSPGIGAPTNTPTTPPQQATPTTRPIDTATPVPSGNNNNNSTPTNTPIPTATRIPTPTIQPNTSGNGGISMNSNNNNNSDFPTSIPTPTTAAVTTTDNKDHGALEFTAPHIGLKSPGEIVKETVTEEKIVKLNEVTDPPLKVAKTTFVSVKMYDQKLENTFKDWLNYLRIQLIKNFH